MLDRLDSSTVLAAHQRGLLKLRTSKVAQAAGLSESSVTEWARGGRVGSDVDRRIREVLSGNAAQVS